MANNPQKSLLNEISDTLSKPENLLKTIPGITGSIVLILKDYSSNKFAFIIGISLIILTIFLLSLKWLLNYLRPAKIIVEGSEEGTLGAYIRGLMPFGENDFLLGRENERKRANAIISNAEFRFGYISGEAGAGKTSFLRSILLKEIRQLGMHPIYVPSVKTNLIDGIKTAIDGNIEDDDIESYFKFLQKNEKKRIILIIDQFEEFFVNVRSAISRKKDIKVISKIINDRSFNVCLLLSLRKEFVDDLQEFAPDVEQPADSRYAIRIRNWDEDMAKNIFDKMVEADRIPFAPQLRATLISDLADNGIVRPVELQIVAKVMADEAIHTLELYKMKDRARGILATYVKSIINPNNKNDNDAQSQIAKFILKSLCDDKNDTKRVVGITNAEFREKVKTLLPNHKEKELNKIVDGVLDRLLKQRVLRMEDSDRYNLIHDYIVLPIRMATADLETSSQSADRLLNKYIELHTTIPRKTLKTILRDATPELKTSPDAKAIIRKTRRNIFMINISPILILAFFVWLFPPKSYLKKRPVYEGYNVNWESTENRHILVGSARDSLTSKSDSTVIWLNGENIKLLQKLKPCISFLMSGDGNWICLVDSTNITLYKNRNDSAFIERFVIAELPLNYSNLSVEKSFRFSPNSQLFITTGRMGNFYAFNLNNEKKHEISPLFKAFDTSMHIRTLSTSISPNEKFICTYRYMKLANGQQQSELVYIPSLNPDTNTIRTIITVKVDPLRTSYNMRYIFGPDNQTMYYSFTVSSGNDFKSRSYNNSVYKLNIAGNLPILLDTIPPLYHSNSRKDFGDIDLKCSNDGKWLIYRSVFGPARITNISTKQNYILTDSSLIGYAFPTLFIDDSSNYCGFNDPQGNYYLLNLKNIPPTKPISPIFKTVKNAGRNPVTPVFDSTQQFIITNNAMGHVFVFSKDSIPQRPFLFFDKQYKINMFWANQQFAYVYANNNIHFGNPFSKVPMDGIRDGRISSEIQDIAISKDHSKLLLLTQTGLFTVEKNLKLWDLVSLHSYNWPSIYRRSNDD